MDLSCWFRYTNFGQRIRQMDTKHTLTGFVSIDRYDQSYLMLQMPAK